VLLCCAVLCCAVLCLRSDRLSACPHLHAVNVAAAPCSLPPLVLTGRRCLYWLPPPAAAEMVRHLRRLQELSLYGHRMHNLARLRRRVNMIRILVSGAELSWRQADRLAVCLVLLHWLPRMHLPFACTLACLPACLSAARLVTMLGSLCGALPAEPRGCSQRGDWQRPQLPLARPCQRGQRRQQRQRRRRRQQQVQQRQRVGGGGGLGGWW
jgi:hypothetical protein